MKTSNWILEGYDSKADWEKAHGVKDDKKKGKTFKIKVCPKCGSDNVGLVLSNSDAGLELEISSDSSESQVKEGKLIEWECKKCNWIGADINEKELTEDEFMKYLDEKGEEVA